MITEDAREADVEYSDENLEVRVVLRVVEHSDVSVARILDTAQSVLAGALTAQGHPPEQVFAMLTNWHNMRASESQEEGGF